MTIGPVVVVLVLSILLFPSLYVLIRSETASTTVTDRADAERQAREFGGRDGPPRRD